MPPHKSNETPSSQKIAFTLYTRGEMGYPQHKFCSGTSQVLLMQHCHNSSRLYVKESLLYSDAYNCSSTMYRSSMGCFNMNCRPQFVVRFTREL